MLMKKYIRALITTTLFFLLSTVIFSDAQGTNDRMGGGPMHEGQMGEGHMAGNRYNGKAQDMTINGSIEINNAIMLTISVGPSEEMVDEMSNHHDRMQNAEIHDFMNTIQVNFTKLVEFEDKTNDGYSSDDSIISEFLLNTNTLEGPILENNEYTIKSKDDNLFTMTIELRFNGSIFFGYKWSLEINYPFNTNTSSLAMLHDIQTNEGNMMANQRRIHADDHMRFNNTAIQDENERIPMFFRWVTTAQIDGKTSDIVASRELNTFAISVPQGKNILYDPEIGTFTENINAANEFLKNIKGEISNFINSIGSPNVIALIIASSTLVVVGVVAYLKKT